MIGRVAAIAVLALSAAWPWAAAAADHLTGIVLMTPAAREAVVHHAPFAGMPAMTMTFVLPANTILHPGDRISADVDRSREPWALSKVRVEGSELPRAAVVVPAFLQVGDRVPAAAFIDQRGRRFTFAALYGAPYALSFVYTRCLDPRMCPLVSAKFRALQGRTRPPVALVEVSLDPGYDRPPVLGRYGAGLGADPARWHLLTGDPRAVLDFAARFGILERSAGPVTIVHSERLAVVDAGGRIRALYDDAAWSPADVAALLARCAGNGARRPPASTLRDRQARGSRPNARG